MQHFDTLVNVLPDYIIITLLDIMGLKETTKLTQHLLEGFLLRLKEKKY